MTLDPLLIEQAYAAATSHPTNGSGLGTDITPSAARSHRRPATTGKTDPESTASRTQQRWRESAELLRWRKVAYSTLVFVLLIAGAALTIGLLTGRRHGAIVWAYVGPAAFGLSVLAIGSLFIYRTSLQRAVQDAIRLSTALALRHEEKDLALSRTDFGSLWAITQKRIDYYHEIATEQARVSFRNGQFAAYAGLVVILVVAVLAGLARSGTAAIAVSVVGVAAAGLCAYVGATFMRAQAAATTQLREYFLQPVEFARVLAAERLLETLDRLDRAPVVSSIIESITAERQAPRREPVR